MRCFIFSSHLLVSLLITLFLRNEIAYVTGAGVTDEIFFPRFEEEATCTAFNGREGLCRPVIRCAAFLTEVEELSRVPCVISETRKGVCCPHTRSPIEDSGVFLQEPQHQPTIELTQVTEQDQDSAIERAQLVADQLQLEEDNLVEQDNVAKEGSPIFLHAKLFASSLAIIARSKKSKILLRASADIAARKGLTAQESNEGLAQRQVSERYRAEFCIPEPVCPKYLYRYRTIDGSCNNVDKLNWGKATQPYKRRLNAIYGNDVDGEVNHGNVTRPSVSGSALPSARLVSSTINPKTINENPSYQNLTTWLWQWGQFVNHDMQLTSITKVVTKGGVIDTPLCCKNGKNVPRNESISECLPIDIPTDDRFFKKFGHNCMEFARSAPTTPSSCTFGPRQQANLITSYIDGSTLYGSDEQKAKSLRGAHEFGKLNILRSKYDHSELMPADETCVPKEKDCPFSAGDGRANEHFDLALIHTLWLREHNRLATELLNLNPHWDDEVIYQETRRIVGAQIQHITYSEYLPIILGQSYAEEKGLLPLDSGYFRKYNKHVDATVTNSFAAAAFRFGHTQVTGTLKEFDENDNEISATNLDLAGSSSKLYFKDSFASLVRGLAKQQSFQVDTFFSSQITNTLFSGGMGPGLDLVAVNIQRGRDHGLQPYVNWRETCNLSPITSWENLAGVMDVETIDRLRLIYQDVRDIDLFIGGVSEFHAPGSLLGPTFRCLIGDQFKSSKIGDRFWYENGEPKQRDTRGSGVEPLASFSPEQLNEIRKTSLARILCDNAGLTKMQPLPFGTPRKGNDKVFCNDETAIPRMNMEPWGDTLVWAK